MSEYDKHETASDWALPVEEYYSVTGRGYGSCGRLLFGNPQVGDLVTYVGSEGNRS